MNQNSDEFKSVLGYSDIAIKMAAVSEQIDDLNGQLTKACESFSVQLMTTIRKQNEEIQQLKTNQENEINRLKAEINELKAYQLQIEKDLRENQVKRPAASLSSSSKKSPKHKRLRIESMSVERKLINSQNNFIGSIVVLNKEQTIAAGSIGEIKVWNPGDGSLVKTIEGHSGYCISCLVVMKDGCLVSGSYDDTIIVWNVNAAQPYIRTLRGHTGAVYCLAALKGERLASGSNDTTIIVWNVNTGQQLNKLIGHINRVSCIASLDDNQLSSGSRDNTIKIWSLNSGEEITTLLGHSQDVRCMLALPDNRLATGSHDDTIRIWNIQTGELIHELEGHNGYVLSLSLLKDELTLASSSADTTIRLWDISTGRLMTVLREHDGAVTSLALLNDGRLISASEDRSIIIWK